MFQSILNPYDVFRSDIQDFYRPDFSQTNKNEIFSTNPFDYLSSTGFYC